MEDFAALVSDLLFYNATLPGPVRHGMMWSAEDLFGNEIAPATISMCVDKLKKAKLLIAEVDATLNYETNVK